MKRDGKSKEQSSKSQGEKNMKVKKTFLDSYKKGYTFFDYALMLTFVVLLAGMFFLKAAEEAFARDISKVMNGLKVD